MRSATAPRNRSASIKRQRQRQRQLDQQRDRDDQAVVAQREPEGARLSTKR